MQRHTLALAVVVFGCSHLAADVQGQTTWYVDDNNCPGPGTGTPADPFCSIQAGVDAASDTDTVLVSPGTYNEVINFSGKAIALRSTGGQDVTTIDGTGLDNSVVKCVSGEGPNTVLEGLTITGGAGTLVGRAERVGGGMYNSESGPTLIDCMFSGNSSGFGGGMYNTRSSPTLDGCGFTGNSAPKGAGMFNHSSSPMLSNCTFTNNVAEFEGFGGGMSNFHDSNPTLVDCTFSGNYAYNHGGGMKIQFASPTLINCTFTGNRAEVAGGGVCVDGGAPVLVNCTFSDNEGGFGGGIATGGGPATLVNCAFYGNEAVLFGGSAGLGGGIIIGGSATLVNCIVSGNSAVNYGGGMYVDNCSDLTMSNCSFSANTAPNGAGVACDLNPELNPSTLDIVNCILRDGPTEIWHGGETTITIGHSNVQGGWPGTGNIDADPLFVDIDGQDDIIGTDDDDLRVQDGSPAIDAAHNDGVPPDAVDLDDDGDTAEPTPLDLAGQPRFLDDLATIDTGSGTPPIVDMGAYEFQPREVIPTVSEWALIVMTLILLTGMKVKFGRGCRVVR